MHEVYGMMVSQDDLGRNITSKIKKYATYNDMVADDSPGFYGIVEENNTVYHWNGSDWVIGFPNIVNEESYTAFEVYAHDKEIPFGYCEELGGYINYYKPTCSSKAVVTNPDGVTGIAPQLTHKFLLRGNTPQEKQDVIVDWGDGTVDNLKEIVPTNLVDEQYKSSSYTIVYGMSHTYQKSGKYIVKIFGTTYQHIQYDDKASDGEDCNLICRVFDYDLPVARHLNNFDSFCAYATMLTNVNVGRASSGQFLEGRNCANVFRHCSNLESALGFNKYAQFRYIDGMFYCCHSLKTVDMVIPAWCHSCSSVFHANVNLEVDVARIIPTDKNAGWQCTKVMCGGLFYLCKKLYGTVPADDLWNSDHNTFKFNSGPFKLAADNIRSQVPQLWGGTASDDIITAE